MEDNDYKYNSYNDKHIALLQRDILLCCSSRNCHVFLLLVTVCKAVLFYIQIKYTCL